jgi:hypothetical protein
METYYGCMFTTLDFPIILDGLLYFRHYEHWPGYSQLKIFQDLFRLLSLIPKVKTIKTVSEMTISNLKTGEGQIRNVVHIKSTQTMDIIRQNRDIMIQPLSKLFRESLRHKPKAY